MSSTTLSSTAFTAVPRAAWTSITVRDSPARNAQTLRTSRSRKGIVARPGQVRRVRVSRRLASGSEEFPFTAEPSPSARPEKRPAAVPERPSEQPSSEEHGEDMSSLELNEKDLEMRGEERDKAVSPAADVLAENEVRVDVVKQLRPTTKTGNNASTGGNGHIGNGTVAQVELRKEAAQQAYLQDQLVKHEAEKLAKSATTLKSSKRPQKRVRSSTRQRLSGSNAMKDTFQAYMNEISREELLGQTEIITLAKRIKASVEVDNAKRSLQSELGRRPSIPELAAKLAIKPEEVQSRLMAGTAAKNTLVSANLRLVTSVARKVASGKSTKTGGLALDDMVQEGSVGLLRAAEKFDVTRGYKFSTYATWWIRAYVMRSITTQSRSIKVPSTIVDEYARIRKEYTRLRESGILKPRDDDVAQALGITPAKMRFVVNVVTRVPTSLDISLSPHGDSHNSRSLGEVVEGHDHIEERMVEDFARKELDKALKDCLRPLERAAIRLRFGLDDGQTRTLRETGALLGLSKERIRQVIFRALPKMKTPEIQRMLTDATTR